MEGGCGGNAPDRRADRLVHDFDLNVKLESDEELEQEPEQEQLAHNVAPQVLNPNP
jgi:Zn-dependent peptidase ImmA (M78 family)